MKLTDEQIIAAASASYLSDAERRSFDGYDGQIAVGDPAGQRTAIRPTRRAAANPLSDRIAELEANASTMNEYYEQVFDDWGKRISELTKQRDELFETLETAYDVTVNHDDRLPFDWAVYCEMLYQSISSVKNFK